jgi:hypothetical protein
MNSIENYLPGLRSQIQRLNDKKRELDDKSGGIALPDVDRTIQKAREIERALNDITMGLRAKMGSTSDLSDYYDKNVRPNERYLLNLSSARMSISGDIQESIGKMDSLLSKLQESKAPVDSRNIGKWYASLSREIGKLEKLSEKSLSFETTGANIKFDRIAAVLRGMKSWPKDIQRVDQELEQAKVGKDLRGWIKWRRETADTFPKRRQADMLENYCRERKFDLDVDRELKDLESAVGKLFADAKDRRVSEDSARDVIQALEMIQRKYDEERQDFSSAVINFSVK